MLTDIIPVSRAGTDMEVTLHDSQARHSGQELCVRFLEC